MKYLFWHTHASWFIIILLLWTAYPFIFSIWPIELILYWVFFEKWVLILVRNFCNSGSVLPNLLLFFIFLFAITASAMFTKSYTSVGFVVMIPAIIGWAWFSYAWNIEIIEKAKRKIID